MFLDIPRGEGAFLVVSYLTEQKPSNASKKNLRRGLATNLATEPCDILATYLATETLRRGDVCDENLATDLAMETLRRPAMSEMAVLCFKVMFHNMLHSFLATKTLRHLATKEAKIKTYSQSP